MSFLFADPTQLWLPLSETDQASVWQHSDWMTPAGDRWTAYLNGLCRQAVLTWLDHEGAAGRPVLPAPPTELMAWALVPGSAIALGSQRWVLVPTDTLVPDELVIPQEWVDLQTWAGDYYVGAQISQDQHWVELWGYATHQQLKTYGTYDSRDRTYTLAREDLIADFSVLWTALDLGLEEQTQAAFAPVPPLEPHHAEALIQRLANPAIAFPRLAIPFQQWGALLEHDPWRNQLYQQRQAALQGHSPFSLSQWFHNQVTTGWQSLEAVFGPEADLAFGLRQASGDTEIRQAKVITLPLPDAPQTVRLVLRLNQEADQRVRIQVQLYPEAGIAGLPPGIELALLTLDGEVVQSVQARDRDNYIQLRRFKCPAGYQFNLRVQLQSVRVIETLTV